LPITTFSKKKLNKILFRGWFFFDIIAVLPFTYMLGNNYNKNAKYQLLYLLKLFRLQKIFKLLEPRQFNNIVKNYYRAKMKKKLD
jgi:hypothetical protein